MQEVASTERGGLQVVTGGSQGVGTWSGWDLSPQFQLRTEDRVNTGFTRRGVVLSTWISGTEINFIFC